jgi:hypothetical protein
MTHEHKQEKENQKKYGVIEKNMKGWLEMYKKEIKKKYHVDRTEVKTFYMAISSLGVLQAQTYNDFIRLLRIKCLRKRQLAKNWVRRMIMQACRGSF